MSAEYGLIGGDLFGTYTMKVQNPDQIIERWTIHAAKNGWTHTRHNVPSGSVFTLYSNDIAFLWIYKEENPHAC